MSAYEVNEGQSFNKFNSGDKFKTPVVEDGVTYITDTEADAAALQGLVTKLGQKAADVPPQPQPAPQPELQPKPEFKNPYERHSHPKEVPVIERKTQKELEDEAKMNAEAANRAKAVQSEFDKIQGAEDADAEAEKTKAETEAIAKTVEDQAKEVKEKQDEKEEAEAEAKNKKIDADAEKVKENAEAAGKSKQRAEADAEASKLKDRAERDRVEAEKTKRR